MSGCTFPGAAVYETPWEARRAEVVLAELLGQIDSGYRPKLCDAGHWHLVGRQSVTRTDDLSRTDDLYNEFPTPRMPSLPPVLPKTRFRNSAEDDDYGNLL